jgi:putative flippase GtrA
MVSMLGGAALNYAAYAATLRWLDVPGQAAVGVAFGSCAGLVSNYLTARHLVFKQKTQS